MDAILSVLQPLLTLGAPGLLTLIGALLWDRKSLKSEVREERSRTERVTELLIALNDKLIRHQLDESQTNRETDSKR